jgi:hypothetical protein
MNQSPPVAPPAPREHATSTTSPSEGFTRSMNSFTSTSWSRPVLWTGPTPMGAQDAEQIPQLTHSAGSTRATYPSLPSVRRTIAMASYGQSW